MSNKKLHEMQQKRATIAAEMRTLHDKIGDAVWTDEQRSQWDEAQHQYNLLDEQIKREEDLRRQDDELAKACSPEGRDNSDSSHPTNEEERRASVFDRFVRSGAGDLSAEERSILKELRAQGTTEGNAGGYTVPTQFRNRVVEAMKAYGGVASVCQLLNTSNGQPLEWIYTDSTEEIGEMIGENTAAGEEDTEFKPITLGAKKMTSKIIRVSSELLQDSGIDMNGYLAARIASRLGRGEAKAIVQGAKNKDASVSVKGLNDWITKTTTAAAAKAFTWSEMLDLKHSVDPAYRNSPRFRFAFNDNTLLAISKMKDNQGRPLWLPDIVGVAPASVLGTQYVIDQAIADADAGNKFVLCGDFDRFVLRRVAYMTLRRLTERYAEFDQVGFLAFHRFDCVLEDGAAIKALVGKGAAAA